MDKRSQYIQTTMQTDLNPRTRRNQPSKTVCQSSWLAAMKAILELPVPTWDNPGSVSGEIDTEKGA